MWNELFCESQRKKWVDFIFFFISSLFNHNRVFLWFFFKSHFNFPFYNFFFVEEVIKSQLSISYKFFFFRKMKILWSFYIRFCAILKKKNYCFSFATELSMFSNISRGFIFQLIYCPIKNSLHKDFLTIRKEKNDSLRNISGQSFQFNITEICPVWIVSVVIYTYIYIYKRSIHVTYKIVQFKKIIHLNPIFKFL